MVRSFRIGKHKATRAEFDAEVLRLYKSGLDLGDYNPKTGTGSGIAGRLRRERTTIWRSLKRSGSNGDHVIEEAKKERAYYKETTDEFLNEPVIKEWTDDMKARRVGNWKYIAYEIKRLCDDLQIFPDQLDLAWGKKWLVLKTDVPLEKLRATKTAARSFFQAQGVSDYDLTQAGFDAKHYGVGKWKHVKFTDEEIRKIDALLLKEMPEARFVFKFGMETCRTLEPIWGLKGEQFYTLNFKAKDGTAKTLYCVNIFRTKTEKAGAPYWTAYVKQDTYVMAKALSDKNGGKIMNGIRPEAVYEVLRRVYREAGVSVEYFYLHPIHGLRHAGAQWWLERTGFNRAVVAEIGGWLAEKTLEDHYGGVPVDMIRGAAADML